MNDYLSGGKGRIEIEKNIHEGMKYPWPSSPRYINLTELQWYNHSMNDPFQVWSESSIYFFQFIFQEIWSVDGRMDGTWINCWQSPRIFPVTTALSGRTLFIPYIGVSQLGCCHFGLDHFLLWEVPLFVLRHLAVPLAFHTRSSSALPPKLWQPTISADTVKYPCETESKLPPSQLPPSPSRWDPLF